MQGSSVYGGADINVLVLGVTDFCCGFLMLYLLRLLESGNVSDAGIMGLFTSRSELKNIFFQVEAGSDKF